MLDAFSWLTDDNKNMNKKFFILSIMVFFTNLKIVTIDSSLVDLVKLSMYYRLLIWAYVILFITSLILSILFSKYLIIGYAKACNKLGNLMFIVYFSLVLCHFVLYEYKTHHYFMMVIAVIYIFLFLIDEIRSMHEGDWSKV